MTETSGPQESADPLPATTTWSVPQQREPFTEYALEGHPGTTSRHPSLTSATLDQDLVTMPPPPPRPPQQRGAGPFDDAESALRHPRYHTLERAGGSPPGTPP